MTGKSPYLVGIPGLPAELLAALKGSRPLSRAVRARLDGKLVELKVLIRAARMAYEDAGGLVSVDPPGEFIEVCRFRWQP